MRKTLHFSQSKRFLDLKITLLLAIILLTGCGPSEKDVQRVHEEAMSQLRTHGAAVQEKTERVMNSADKLSHAIAEMHTEGDLSAQQINQLLKGTIEKQTEFLAAWVCLEQGVLKNTEKDSQNNKGYDSNGRFVPYWRRVNDDIQLDHLKNYTKKGPGDYYLIPFNTGREQIFNPMVTQVGDRRLFKTIFAVPIRFGTKVVGVVGIDLPLRDFFEPIVKQIRFFGIGYCFIVSNNGTMVAHPHKWANVGRTMELFQFHPDSIRAVAEGKEAIEIKASKTTGNKATYMFVPIRVSEHSKPWGLVANIPFDYLRQKARE